jgi:hypothetical protein
MLPLRDPLDHEEALEDAEEALEEALEEAEEVKDVIEDVTEDAIDEEELSSWIFNFCTASVGTPVVPFVAPLLRSRGSPLPTPN